MKIYAALDINYHIRQEQSILESQLRVLKSVIEYSKIPVTLHCIWMIKTQLSLIDVQSFLLINCGL